MKDFTGLKKPLGCVRRCMDTDLKFPDFAALFEGERGTLLLLSGGDHPEANLQGLALFPFLELCQEENGAKLLQGKEVLAEDADGLGLMDAVLKACAFPEEKGEEFPFGLFGFFSYDLKNRLEKLPDTVLDDLFLPLYLLFAPRLLLWRKGDEKKLCMKALFLEGEGPETALSLLDSVEERLRKACTQRPLPGLLSASGPLSSTFTSRTYGEAVTRIREHILRGEVYQVNLSQRFRVAFEGRAFDLFLKMWETAPQPFSAFFQAGDFQLASLSPERFVRVEGDRIESHPIKGTRPRGKTVKEDARLKEELETSEKDGAELAMIVDLVRNDLGRIAVTGSVEVPIAGRTEIWPHLFHRVAVVRAKLSEGKGGGDVLKAAFPPGSVTGCPRIRAMELIDALEPRRRHAYTGSLGFLGFDGSLDLSVAIRTVIVRGGVAHYAAGGGVVWDSDPEGEYMESLHKAAPFFRALGLDAEAINGKKGADPLIWRDGHFMSLSAAGIPLDSPVLRHGRGLFETLRVERGRALHLKEHADRLAGSVPEVTGKKMPGVCWPQVIEGLCRHHPEAARRGQLHLLAMDTGEAFLSLAAILKPLSPALKRDALVLCSHPEPFFSPMARHKSFAYVFFARAREEAEKRGADEALILAPDGTVLEGSFSSILLVSAGKVRVPEGPLLPGVTREKLLVWFKEKGWPVERKRLSMDDLEKGDFLFCCSSLRGLMWVKRLEGKVFGQPDALWLEEMRTALGDPEEGWG